MSKAVKLEFKELSRILVLIGGILLILFGLFTVLGGSFDSRYIGISLSGSIFGIVVGLIALYSSTRIGEPSGRSSSQFWATLQGDWADSLFCLVA